MSGRSRTWSRRRFVGGTAAALAAGLTGAWRGSRRVPMLSLLPFLARPTVRSIDIQARNGELPATAILQVRSAAEDEWTPFGSPVTVDPGAFLHWDLDGLVGGSRYDYRVLLGSPGGEPGPVALGRFTTQRTGEQAFTAALMTDSHTGTFPEGRPELDVLDAVVHNVRRDHPELVLALGDNVAWPTSRNRPQTDEVGALRAYTMYRRHMAPLTMSSPHFGLIGNWEGESGKFPAGAIATAGNVRRRFLPNPDHRTYPQGGSAAEDYYAFTWGPALFVVLNVQSYTVPSGEQPSRRDDVTVVEDWTLGAAQMAWLVRTLTSSDAPYKFVCIHHAVGGNAANEVETLYGRGGGRAARVGEQARLHELMLDTGVQVFFYGHDHVFVDQVVDGLHYALPGSAGAPWRFGRDITGYGSFWTDAGHARLMVRPEQSTVSYVNQSGDVIHEFVVRPGS